MISLKFCTIVVLVVAPITSTVKVNMQGTLSLGQHILESLSNIVKTNFLANSQVSRRLGSAMPAFARMLNAIDPDSERIKWSVDAEAFCKDMAFCEEPQKMNFVIDYVTLMGKAVESIFDSVLNHAGSNGPAAGTIFIQKLTLVLRDVHRILRHADTHVKEDREAHQWVSVLKRISAKFQDQALVLVYEKLPGDTKEVHNVRKKLIQKLIIAIIIVENKYQGRLCSELKMCIRDYEVTKTLYTFLDYFKDAPDKRAREFVKYFYESLPEDFFYFTDEDTGHEFQVVLSEMSFTSTVPTKAILLSVLKTVEARKIYLKTNNDTMKGYDSQLANIILSDMDHFYYHVRRKRFPFENFMEIFAGWMQRGGRLGVHVRQLIRDIKKKLKTVPKELLNKLIYEVRVFLELTVDPVR